MKQRGTIVKLNNINLRRDNVEILKNVSWEIFGGQHWVIIGRNGAGKTSLLKLVTGYLWPNSGEIQVLDRVYGQIDLRELRKSIGWVSSSFTTLLEPATTALEIIISGCYSSSKLYHKISSREVEAAKRMLDFLDCGYLHNRRWGVLSQGEQQKILLGRALQAQPRILILDEPCAGLDLRARENMLALFEKIGYSEQAPTIVLVTHHVEEITPIFTHVLLLRSGMVLAQGKIAQIITSENMSVAYGINIKVEQHNQRYCSRVIPGNS